MTNLTTVNLTNGVPTSGTGTVSTIDNLLQSLNTNGQTTSAASAPVVIASDQSAISVQTPPHTFTDKSGTIATGGTHQTLAAINASRHRIIIQNPLTATGQGILTAESLFINFTSNAGINNGTSIELVPGAIYDSGVGPPTSELISVNATTTSHAYIAKEM